MSKTIILFITIAFVVGMLMVGVGNYLNNGIFNPFAVIYNDNTIDSTPFPSFMPGSSYGEEKQLEPFTKMNIGIVGGDIILRQGREYSLSYRLSTKEKIQQFQVKDGTLTFITKREASWGYNGDGHRDNQVIITLPTAQGFEDVTLSTISGDITLDELFFTNMGLATVSGDIELGKATGDSLTLDTTSGDLELLIGDIGYFEGNTVSGDMEMNGNFNRMFCSLVSGDIEFNGDLTGDGDFNTVSGDVTLSVKNKLAVRASTMQGITVNDEYYKRKCNLQNGGVPVQISTTGGDIEVYMGLK